MPDWSRDLDVYASEFQHTGVRGALNRYHNVDRDWEDLAASRGKAIDVPGLLIGGDRDGPTIWGGPAIAASDTTLPKRHRSRSSRGAATGPSRSSPMRSTRR